MKNQLSQELEDCRRHRKNLQQLTHELTKERDRLRDITNRQTETILRQVDHEIEKNTLIAKLTEELNDLRGNRQYAQQYLDTVAEVTAKYQKELQKKLSELQV